VTESAILKGGSSVRASKLLLLALTLAVAVVAIAFAGQSGTYQQGEITAWSKAGRNLVLGGPPLGAEGQSGIGVTAVALRTNRFSLEAGDYTYEFQSPKKDFEVGDKVRFRIDHGRLFIVAKNGKKLRYDIIATTKKAHN
jgi:DNA-directed RNA polymerase subunit E'/Rpb7